MQESYILLLHNMMGLSYVTEHGYFNPTYDLLLNPSRYVLRLNLTKPFFKQH